MKKDYPWQNNDSLIEAILFVCFIYGGGFLLAFLIVGLIILVENIFKI